MKRATSGPTEPTELPERLAPARPRDLPEPPGAALRRPVLSVTGDERRRRSDLVATEEPLEVRVVAEERGRRVKHSVAVTMRTPGHDRELAAGFLFTEGVVSGGDAIWKIAHCETGPAESAGNVVEVFLAPEVEFDPARFTRNVYTTSSCGVCGKTSLELLKVVCPAPPRGDFRVSAATLAALPAKLRDAQPVFERTGGLHASGLFSPEGELLLLREDVGRHNALDKVIGALLLEDRLPASDTLVLVSGRASYELVQKAVMAGIPALVAVGAPSSLAVTTAHELGMTLVGFLREASFNVYAGEERMGP